MATMNQKIEHINQVRANATRLMDTIKALQGLRKDWDYLGLSSALKDADFTGSNEGLTAAQIAGVYTTLAAIETLLGSGHGTNLTAVK